MSEIFEDEVRIYAYDRNIHSMFDTVTRLESLQIDCHTDDGDVQMNEELTEEMIEEYRKTMIDKVPPHGSSMQIKRRTGKQEIKADEKPVGEPESLELCVVANSDSRISNEIGHRSQKTSSCKEVHTNKKRQRSKNFHAQRKCGRTTRPAGSLYHGMDWRSKRKHGATHDDTAKRQVHSTAALYLS